MIKKLFTFFIFLGLVGFGFSTVTGIITTSDNGVLRITTDEDGLSGALIDSETIVITGSGTIQGDVDIVSSQLKFSGVNGNNDANAPLTYGARANIVDNLDIMNSSSVIFETSGGRRNILISELSGGSEIIETGTPGNLFVYSQTDAVITDAIFRGIWVHEVYRNFAKFFNVEYLDTGAGQLNWEAGRLDRYGINIPSTTTGWYSWMGTGSGGNNAFWDWNPKSIDATKIVHQSTNNDYYQGYTLSEVFLDKFTSLPISDVRVVYKDDRTNVGSDLIEISEYLTDASGVLVGTVDTRDLSTGSSIQRPTLYVLTNQSRLIGGTSTTFGSLPNTQNYVMDSISSELLVRSYLHLENPSSLNLNSEVGTIDADLNVEEYNNYYLTEDLGVTETNMATVLSYSSLDNLETFYDRSKAEWRDNDDFPIFTYGSGTIDLGNVSLNVNSTNSPVYDYVLGENTVYIKSSTFSTTSKINSIISSGDIIIDDSVPNDVLVVELVAVNLSISGLPIDVGSNALCKFIDNYDNSETIISADGGGNIIYSSFSGRTINYFCDAIGFERGDLGSSTLGSFGADIVIGLETYKDKVGTKLYGNGIASQKNLVTYSELDNRIYIDYSAVQPIVTYESFFDKVDEIFSSSFGLDYDIDFDFDSGRFKIESDSLLRLSPKSGASSDPEIDFISYVSGDSNPNTPYVSLEGRNIIRPSVDYTFDKDLDKNYNFLIDEVKVLNVALNDSEVLLLYKDQLRALEFDISVTDYNSTSGDLDFDVTIPFIEKNQILICDFYYSKK
jgi:hypothetical protein